MVPAAEETQMTLVGVDVAISTPQSASFTSGLDQSLALNYNPDLLVGGGTLSSTPSGSPASTASATQDPFTDAPSSATAAHGSIGPPAGPGLATLNTAYPGSAIAQQSAGSSSLFLWLLIGGGVLLAFSGGHK
jgi:hypothetical protein